jgi:cytochrome c nitrite reductase small subunit
VTGSGLGIGASTFVFAQGASYLSSDPRACVNCHIMRPQYDGWQKASHHAVAGCVDCHLPAAGLAKWIAKATHGYRHSTAFTLQDFAEPIEVTPGDVMILQQRCLGCHSDAVRDLVAGARSGEDPGCIRCHAGVGHGERAGLGGPDRGSGELAHRERGEKR